MCQFPVDRELGRLRSELDERTWLVLVAARCGPPDRLADSAKERKDRRRDGLILLVGPGAKRGLHVGDVAAMDVVPMVLYALGLPIFVDLKGELPLSAFTDKFRGVHPVQTAPRCDFDRMDDFIEYFKER